MAEEGQRLYLAFLPLHQKIPSTPKPIEMVSEDRSHRSAMRDFASCFSEHAVRVTDASCYGGRSSIMTAATLTGSSTSGNYEDTELSIQTATTCVFKAKLSTGKPLLIQLTWSRVGPSLSIGVDDSPELMQSWRPKLLKFKKGSHCLTAATSFHWDFSAASFGPGPEPIGNFFVAVIVDAEIALLLGDQRGEFLERFKVAEFSMGYRREQVVGSDLHSIIRTQLDNGGKRHEIAIRCRGGRRDGEDAELSVSIDNNRVVNVGKMKWNFRGNQTVFIDGSPVDLLWDMHGWWFGSMPEHAVFLFRRRSALESRLWLEEQKAVDFSLLIQAFRSPGSL